MPPSRFAAKFLGIFGKAGVRRFFRRTTARNGDDAARQAAVRDAMEPSLRHEAQQAARQAYARDLGNLFRNGRVPKRSELDTLARRQGWKVTQTPNGPPKYVDENGIVRMTLKSGSTRAPGSGHPHIELRNSNGDRVDPFGNLVNRRDPGNHTPIQLD